MTPIAIPSRLAAASSIPSSATRCPLRLLFASLVTINAVGSSSGVTTRPADDKSCYVVVREDAPSHGITIRRSQTLLVELSAQPSTGFIWVISHFDPTFWNRGTLEDAELQRLRKKGVIREPAPDDGRFGGGDWKVFRLKPLRVGLSHLEFRDARPWQPDAPARTFALTVTVKAGK